MIDEEPIGLVEAAAVLECVPQIRQAHSNNCRW